MEEVLCAGNIEEDLGYMEIQIKQKIVNLEVDFLL